MPTNDLEEMLFGGGATQVPTGASSIDKFLHVVAHGIDWQAGVGHRSSYDFAANVDFDALFAQSPEVLNRYLDYVHDHVLAKVDNDTSFAGAPGYDDSIVDSISVLKRIMAASQRAGVEPRISQDKAAALLNLSNQIEHLMEGEGPGEDDFKAFTRLRALVGGLAESAQRSSPRP